MAKRKPTAAELAAQAQSMEDAEIQRAFEQGITTLALVLSMVVPSIFMVIHALSAQAGSVHLLIWMKFLIFLSTSTQLIPALL